jgi:tRNA (cmo5U34)-methyltransferase
MILDKDRDFTFQGIAGEFDSHVRGQLPWYDTVKNIVCFIIRSYLQNHGIIYDIGCSTGNIARRLLNTVNGRDYKIIGIDREQKMLDLYPKDEKTQTFRADCVTFDYEPFDVGLLFLTCQFLDVNIRKEFLEKLYRIKKKGGIIIIIDKFINGSTDAYFNSVMNKFNMLLKLENGLTAEDILNKELSLTGVQFPLSKHEELPGKQITFFAMGDFRGYVIL